MTMTSLVNYEDESRHLGDNYFAPLTNLETAIEQIKKACRDNNSLIDILNELAEFIQSDTSREIIGLEEKLNRGSRQDLFRRATELKNRFAMRVAKNQMLLTEQHVYIQILSAIKTTWYQKIHPRIVDGASNSEIDQLIQDELVSPIHKAIVRYDFSITSENVCGMLYFLTGLCHIYWDSEC